MINTYQWIVKEKRNKNIDLFEQLLQQKNMNIFTLFEEIEHDPFLLKDMDNAVSIVLEAIKNNKKILISGDYDCDGVTSTYLLLDFFSNFPNDCKHYIPHRIIEGYGCSMKMVDYVVSNNIDLVITVDNGITSFDVIQALRNYNVDVIVTDHHLCKEQLPNANAIINPTQPYDNYPLKKIAGVGVAFKFIQAITIRLGLESKLWEKYYDIVALGTISDVMPLINENRTIVQKGLEQLKNSNNFGLKELIKFTKKQSNKILSEDIAFSISPKINAASRMKDANIALSLFLSKSKEEAMFYGQQLNELNEKRKIDTEKFFNVAELYLTNSNFDFETNNPIVVVLKNCSKGIIGIISSKLTEKYFRPSFVFCEENGILHGSCRSVNNINIINMVEYAKDTLLSFGGHNEACGLSLNYKNLEKFINKINEFSKNNINQEFIKPILHADMVLLEEDITLENFELIQDLEPFGNKNEKPYFVLDDLKVLKIQKIGKGESQGKHLKITFQCNNQEIDGIGFFMGEYYDLIPCNTKIDVLFQFNINEFNNKKTIQFFIKDIKQKYDYNYGITEDEEIMYKENEISVLDISNEFNVNYNILVPKKEEYQIVFSVIKELLSKESVVVSTIELLSTYILSKGKLDNLIPFKLYRILESLCEANIICYKKCFNGMIIISKLIQSKEIINISQTNSYIKLNSNN